MPDEIHDRSRVSPRDTRYETFPVFDPAFGSEVQARREAQTRRERDRRIRLQTWFAIIVTAFGPAVASLVYIHGPRSTHWVQAIYFASKVVLFSFPLLWWWRLERSRGVRLTQDPSLGRRPSMLVDIAMGGGTGLGIGLFIWSAYWFAFRDVLDPAWLVNKVKQFGAYDHFVAYAIFLAVINSGLEEYYWRWFVFGRLRRVIRFPVAIILSSVAFSLHHFVVLQQFLSSVWLAGLCSAGVATGGAMWAYRYHRTARLWGVWLSHFLIDVAVLSVGYHLLFMS